MTISNGVNPIEILKTLNLPNPVRITPVTGGADSTIWRVENSDGKLYALRLMRREQAPEVGREVSLMEVAVRQGVAVPRVLAHSVWQERPVLLLEWCEGRILIDEIQKRIGRIWQLGVLFGKNQAAINRVIVSADLLPNSNGWIETITRENPQLQAGLQKLNLRNDCLLHLDYHPLNVLTDGKRITGVIDWTNAAVGDPRFDFARTVTLLRISPAPVNISALVMATFRVVLEAAWRRGYQQIAGPMRNLDLFYVWAGLAMERDLAPKLGQRTDLKIQDIERIRNWTQKWQRRANIAD